MRRRFAFVYNDLASLLATLSALPTLVGQVVSNANNYPQSNPEGRRQSLSGSISLAQRFSLPLEFAPTIGCVVLEDPPNELCQRLVFMENRDTRFRKLCV
jgi:hypothetical protein